ncbi:hypothetical protein ACFPK9_08140 [Rubritalea spongiae]|uniref:Lipoprotein n=1 Tax=Rubritalea spongiae TaxID=430797 RepID=A0ABW5E1P8_9BACT
MFCKFLLSLIALTSAFSLTSCVTKQTTRQGNEVVDEKYIIHRPVKKFIEKAEFE